MEEMKWQIQEYGFFRGIAYWLSRRAVEKSPEWPTLKLITTNRATRTAGFWLVFTPICARLLEASPAQVAIGQIVISLSLPFSWVLLFFSALFFFLARAIFLAKCPAIIQKFDSPSDAISQRVTPRQFLIQLLEDVEKGTKHYAVHETLIDMICDKNYREYIADHVRDNDKLKAFYSPKQLTYLNEFLAMHAGRFPNMEIQAKEQFDEIFWYAFNYLGTECSPGWKLMVAASIILGAIPLGVILAQSVLYVAAAI